jgi:hypothetical protein
MLLIADTQFKTSNRECAVDMGVLLPDFQKSVSNLLSRCGPSDNRPLAHEDVQSGALEPANAQMPQL